MEEELRFLPGRDTHGLCLYPSESVARAALSWLGASWKNGTMPCTEDVGDVGSLAFCTRRRRSVWRCRGSRMKAEMHSGTPLVHASTCW